MDSISKELIKKTIEFWSPKYGYEISEEDAIEIIQNIREFSKVLIEIDRSQKAIIQKESKDP